MLDVAVANRLLSPRAIRSRIRSSGRHLRAHHGMRVRYFTMLRSLRRRLLTALHADAGQKEDTVGDHIVHPHYLHNVSIPAKCG